jgi:hypothetical protein
VVQRLHGDAGQREGPRDQADGLAKNEETQYQAMFRYGGHQSLTRTWLKPTHQTHGLVYRQLFGHVLGKGFAADVHCVTGAPREAMARSPRPRTAASAGRGAGGPWSWALRPANESDALKRYLAGGFVRGAAPPPAAHRIAVHGPRGTTHRESTMPEVSNWQLGREMEYPFEEVRPRGSSAW